MFWVGARGARLGGWSERRYSRLFQRISNDDALVILRALKPSSMSFERPHLKRP